MKTLKDLFEKEFKNLYALEKQIQNTMESLELTKSKKLKKCIVKFITQNSKDYITIQEMAQNLSVNPGNTVDSVAQEMLDNIAEIDNLDMDAKLKNAGLTTSLNRLVTYKTVNYYNVRRLAKALEMKKDSKTLKKIREKNESIEKKLKSLTRKKVFKKAAK